jgi:23S rRNA pseudouridine955/2504/2580 synthase
MNKIVTVYEDENCIVFDKPAGLAVQGGKGVGVNLDDLLASSYTPRPLLVHRLDKETSGLILTAKSSADAAYFSKIIEGRKAVKRYLALCVKQGEDILESGIIKTNLNIKGEEKNTETKYKIISQFNFADEVLTMFELELGTGRMHQIRRTLSKIGYPILGDDKYGDFKLNKKLHKEYGLKKMLLHSACIIMPLPNKKILDLKSPPPTYWAEFCKNTLKNQE